MLQSILFISFICIGLPSSTRGLGQHFTCDELSALYSQKCRGNTPEHDVDTWCFSLTPAEIQSGVYQLNLYDQDGDGYVTYSEFASNYGGGDPISAWNEIRVWNDDGSAPVSIINFLLPQMKDLAISQLKTYSRSYQKCNEHKSMYSANCGCPQTSIGSWCISLDDVTDPALVQLFLDFDADGNGQLTVEEFGQGMVRSGSTLTRDEIIAQFADVSGGTSEINMLAWIMYPIG